VSARVDWLGGPSEEWIIANVDRRVTLARGGGKAGRAR